MADNKVSIVFIPDFGKRLRQMDPAIPIWIVQSDQNDPVIADLWNKKTGKITSFRPQEFVYLAGTVDLHHPGWIEMEILGLPEAEVKAVLPEFGEGQLAPTQNGFVFRRDT